VVSGASKIIKTDAKAKKRLPLLSSNKSAIVIKSNTYLVLGYLMLAGMASINLRLDGSSISGQQW